MTARQEFKHDLALELGVSLASLDRMSEREFRQWVAYANKRLLPSRRLEAYLAQVCSVVAQCAGNSEMKLSDFLLEFGKRTPKKKEPGQQVAIIGAIAGRRVFKLPRKEKLDGYLSRLARCFAWAKRCRVHYWPNCSRTQSGAIRQEARPRNRNGSQCGSDWSRLITTAAAAAVAVDQLVKGAANFKDLSEITGASAESLASFAVAAATAGTEMGTIAEASVKLTKNLTGVDDESKAAGAALAALGLNIKQFKALDPATQMETVAKALAGFEDGASKTAVAVALLGKAARNCFHS